MAEAKASEGTKYVIERRIDAWAIATNDAAASDEGALPEGSLVYLAVGEQKAHGAPTALTRWGEAQGVKFVTGHYRAIPKSNITEDDLEGETTTKVRRKR
jgi:hypothetical protein